MSKDKSIARQVFEEIQSKANLALVDEIVVSDYVGHTPMGDIHGPSGARQFDAILREAFPDFQIVVDDQIAEGDRVATRWTCRGTHDGEFQGIATTGEQIWRVLRFMFHRVLTADTRVGRKLRPKLLSQGEPLVRTRPQNLVAAGVKRVPKTATVRDGLPVLDGGMLVQSVITDAGCATGNVQPARHCARSRWACWR